MVPPSTKQQALEGLHEAGVIDKDEDVNRWSRANGPDVPFLNREGAKKVGSELGVDRIMIGGSRTEWLIATLVRAGVDGGPHDYFQQGKTDPAMTTDGWVAIAEAVLDG